MIMFCLYSSELMRYCISLVIRQSFPLPIQSQRSRSILKDRSRSLGLFRKGKTHIIAKFHRTDLVICSNFIEGKTPSNSQINTVTKTSPNLCALMNIIVTCNISNKESDLNTGHMLKNYSHLKIRDGDEMMAFILHRNCGS